MVCNVGLTLHFGYITTTPDYHVNILNNPGDDSKQVTYSSIEQRWFVEDCRMVTKVIKQVIPVQQNGDSCSQVSGP